MPRVGIADLGSNTARLVVFDYEPGRWVRMVDSVREQTRLGAGLAKGNRLTAGAIERTVAALDLFSDYAAATGLDQVHVLGTSALRDAENRQEFFDRIAPLNLDVKIVSGEEEARLGVNAVANGFALDDAWVIDLGGGSAQISRMRDRKFVEGEAFPLGAVRLTEAHLKSDPIKRGEVRDLEEMVEAHLARLVKRMRKDDVPLVAVGGTVRNLARMAQRASGYPLRLLHGYSFSRADLESVTEGLLESKVKQRARLAGLNPARADIIVAGALVFRWLLREAKRDHVLISGYGVREGAFYELFLDPPFRLDGVRGFAVENLLARHPQPRRHIEQVRFLALRLFEELKPLHGLGTADRELLSVAALLHDIGKTIDYYRHDKHGDYLISAGALDGFSHAEQALVALLVRYHRKGTPRVGTYKGVLDAADEARLQALSSCLRLAESLERSRAGRVRDVRAELSKKTVRLTLLAAEEPVVELWEAAQHAPLISQAFGRELELTAEVVD